MIFWILILWFLPFTSSDGIHFQYSDIDKALNKAKEHDKLIFVDTYATWCKPCKQMDRVFQKPEVGTFFNRHFVSVKVDMDGRLGRTMQKKYGVVFLPTLLILNQDGTIKNKVDRLVSAEELLDLAEQAISGTSKMAESTTLFNNPFDTKLTARETNPELITEENAPILYVYDERTSSARPQIMYHEAYLHLQLMDGKQDQVVKKYLSTQKDWSTEKNIRFIFDFANTTRSNLFTYMIDNRSRFYEVIGKEKVERSIEILAYQRLNNGVPRPDLVEAVDLYSMIHPGSGETRGHRYYLTRLIDEGKKDEFMTLAKDYLDRLNPYDAQIIHSYVLIDLNRGFTSTTLDHRLEMMETAIRLQPENAHYILTMANLYYLKEDRERAIKYCQRAINLASENGVDLTEFNRLKYKIKSL